jgi:hypothetical protein
MVGLSKVSYFGDVTSRYLIILIMVEKILKLKAIQGALGK